MDRVLKSDAHVGDAILREFAANEALT